MIEGVKAVSRAIEGKIKVQGYESDMVTIMDLLSIFIFVHFFLIKSRLLVTLTFFRLSSPKPSKSIYLDSLAFISLRICYLYCRAILLSGDSFKAYWIYFKPSEKLFYLHEILQGQQEHIRELCKSLNSSFQSSLPNSSVPGPFQDYQFSSI